MSTKTTFQKIIASLLIVFTIVPCFYCFNAIEVKAYGETFIIDPGHGGEDPGALGSDPYREEADDTLRLSLKVGSIVSQYTSVAYTRTTDATLSLKERSSMANAGGHQYLISIHRNSFSDPAAKGLSIFYYNGLSATSTSAKFATAVYNEVIAVTPYYSRGVKSENFHMVREPNMPSCLIETGFISNNNDNKIFDDYFDEIAFAIAKGMLSMIGITPTDSVDTQLNGYSPIDLGANFYAYVRQSSTGLYLTRGSGDNVCVTNGIDNASQRFHFVRQTNGSYSLGIDGTPLWMDVTDANYSDGANIRMYTGNGNNSQKFFIYYIGGEFYFRAMYNSKVFDVDASTNNVQLYGKDATYNTRAFEILKVNLDGTNWNSYIGSDFPCYIRNYATGYLLTAEGDNAIFRYRTYDDDQKWIITRNEYGGHIIKSVATGKVLDVSGAKLDSGTDIDLYEENGSKAQSFFFIHAGDSNFYIKPSYTNTVMDMDASSYEVHAYPYGTNQTQLDAQIFEIITEHHIDSNGSIYAPDKLGNKFTAQITLNGTSLALTDNGSSVTPSENTCSANQYWDFSYDTETNSYKITGNSGKVLDVNSAGYWNGSLIQVYESNDTYAQRFRFYDAGYGYLISPVNTQKVVEVSTDHSAVQLNGSTYGDYRCFAISIVSFNGKEAVDLGDEFTSSIQNKESGLYLTGSEGAPLNCTSTTSQWTFIRQADGSYVMKHPTLNKVVDVVSGKVASGTGLQLYQANESLAQSFYIYEADGGYILVCAKSGKAIDMDADSKEVHTYPTLANDLAIKAQIFVLADVSADTTDTLIIKDSSNLSKNEIYATKVPEKMTSSWIADQFDNENVVVFDVNGNQVADTAKCGTGHKVALVKNGEIVDSLTIIVNGDVTGEGEVDATDYLQIKSVFLKKFSFNSSNTIAADIDANGLIDATDYLRIKAHFLGTYNLYE